MKCPGVALLLPAWLALSCLQCQFCLAAQTQVINLENVAQWSLSNVHGNNNISIDNVTIPSYVLETLQQRGLINQNHEDLAHRYNERDLAWIANDTWTYTASWNLHLESYLQEEFNEETDSEVEINTYVSEIYRHRHLHAVLLLHGIDTAATITLNNYSMGSIANSHRRHVFEITDSVLFSSTNTSHVNVLEITIQPAAVFAATQASEYSRTVPYTKQLGSTGQYNFIRKAASDFGWDWGPSFGPAGISAGVELILKTSGEVLDSSGGEKQNKSNPKKVSSDAECADSPVYLMDVGLWQHHFPTNESILVTADAFFRPILTTAQVEKLLKKHDGENFTTDAGVLEISIAGPSTNTANTTELPPTKIWSSEVNVDFSIDELVSNTSQYSKKESADWVIQRSVNVLVTPPYELWWPWDLGTPVLYDVTVTFKPCSTKEGGSTWSLPGSILQLGKRKEEGNDGSGGGNSVNYQVVHRQIGFRTVELIQEPIITNTSDNTHNKNNKSTSKVVGESFYFKINGVSIFARGANIVPLDLIPTKVTPNRIKHAVSSARHANMNFLRVWGGGRYFPDIFYEECDRNGILIWQEFAYACAMYPVSPFYLHEAKEEARQEVLRLNSHPSVALWGGNNENEAAFTWFPETKAHPGLYRSDYEVLFLDVLREQVLSLDPGAIYVDSSPSNGLVRDTPTNKKNNKSNLNSTTDAPLQGGGCFSSFSKREKDSLVIEEEKIKKKWGDVTDPTQGDIHFYDYSSNLLDPKTYPAAKFISEFGYMSLPSFDSYKKQSNKEDWAVDGALMEYRMRHGDGLKQIKEQLGIHFGVSMAAKERKKKILGSTKNSTYINNRDVFQAFVYLTQLQQALIYETAATTWRRGKTDPLAQTAGLLYWQLNDVWAGPSWSGINYDGRWKALHYAARRFFSPLAIFGSKQESKSGIGVLKNKFNRVKSNEEQVEVWIVNDGRDDVQGWIEIYAIPFQSNSSLEKIDMLSLTKLEGDLKIKPSVISTAATAAAAGGGAVASNRTYTMEISRFNNSSNSTTLNVPGSGSVRAWESDFSETQWGSVEAAASEVYLQLRFCTATENTYTTEDDVNNPAGGGDSCLDNVMLLGELKDAFLAEEIEVIATVEKTKFYKNKENGFGGGGGGLVSSLVSDKDSAAMVDSKNAIFEVTLTAQGGVALYLFLESPISGFFSDNLITVVPWEKPRKILFYLDEGYEDKEEERKNMGITEEEFKSSLRVMWLQKALNYFPVEEGQKEKMSLAAVIFSSLVFFKIFVVSILVIFVALLAYRLSDA